MGVSKHLRHLLFTRHIFSRLLMLLLRSNNSAWDLDKVLLRALIDGECCVLLHFSHLRLAMLLVLLVCCDDRLYIMTVLDPAGVQLCLLAMIVLFLVVLLPFASIHIITLIWIIRKVFVLLNMAGFFIIATSLSP